MEENLKIQFREFKATRKLTNIKPNERWQVCLLLLEIYKRSHFKFKIKKQIAQSIKILSFSNLLKSSLFF